MQHTHTIHKSLESLGVQVSLMGVDGYVMFVQQKHQHQKILQEKERSQRMNS